MKKAILLIAALLLLGSLAFGDVAIGCWGRTVFQAAGGSSDPAMTSVYQGWGPNWWGSTRMGVTMSFSSKVLSFKITTYYNGSQSNDGENVTTGNVNLANMYGVVKVIPDMLSLNVGYMNGDGYDDYRLTQPNPNSDMNNNLGRMAGWGLWITLAPKDLNFQVTVNLMTPPPNGVVKWEPTGGFDRENDWVYMLHNINVAASYTVPDILKVTAAFMNQDASGKANNVTTPTNPSFYEAFARVELLAIQGMTLWVDGAFTGFESTNYALQTDLGFGYKLGDLGIYLAAAVKIPMTGATPNINIAANLEVNYNIKPITIGLIVDGVYNTVATGNIQQLAFQPYIGLDDLSMRICFDYMIQQGDYAYNYWSVPIYFTFSF